MSNEQEEWIHATNAAQFRAGSVFGWPDRRSETGFLSGIVVRSDPLHLRVLVRDIRAGVVNAKA